MKNVLLFILTFILSGLLVAGGIWGLEKAGKITYTQKIKQELKTIDATELIHQLIPDEGEKIGRWEICKKLGNRIKWDSLSMNTNTWKGKCILSFNLPDKAFEEIVIKEDGKEDRGIERFLFPYYKSPMKLREKLIPCEWEVSITGKGSEYLGFSLFCNDGYPPYHNIPGLSFLCMIGSWRLKNGDYIEQVKDEIRVQFKGKVTAWLLLEEATLSCRFKSREE